jgi:hypothetical protein
LNVQDRRIHLGATNRKLWTPKKQIDNINQMIKINVQEISQESDNNAFCIGRIELLSFEPNAV